jgi:DNA-directed RNA polymerase sigma subunit (sigma70/sigma32)
MTIKTWADYKYYRKSNSRINLDVENFLIHQLAKDRNKVILEFCNLYHPIIKSFVKKYSWSNVAEEDLYSCAREGLILAIDNFDITKNFRFGTYSTHYILGGIRRAVDLTNNTIKKPSHVNRIIHKMNVLPEDAEIYSSLMNEGFTKDQIDNGLNARELKMTDLGDALEVKTVDIYEIFQDADLKCSLNKLTARESAAIVLKFGLFKTRLHTFKELDKIFYCDTEIWMKKLLTKLKELLQNESS